MVFLVNFWSSKCKCIPRDSPITEKLYEKPGQQLNAGPLILAIDALHTTLSLSLGGLESPFPVDTSGGKLYARLPCNDGRRTGPINERRTGMAARKSTIFRRLETTSV
jgi:hypothetical protein